jgi:threonine dehydrogenase-like Zn-dependent dehydrogenase
MIAPPAGANLAVVRHDGAFVLERQSLPPLSAQGVRLQILLAAVCGTDRQIARGERSDAATVLGHEGVAEVAACGSAVSGFTAGDVVVFNPVNPRDQDEILGHSTPGLFQRFLDVPAHELVRRALVEPLPHGLRLEAAVLAEPLGTVVYTHELLRELPCLRSLWIVGAGPLGILHALYARRVAGISRVRLLCNATPRRHWLGARPELAGIEIGSLEPAALTQSQAPDAVLLCTPARSTPAALATAVAAIAEGGGLGVIGGAGQCEVAALPGVDLVALRRDNACGNGKGLTAAVVAGGKRVLLFGQRGTAARHLRAAMEQLAADPAFTVVLTHRVPLAALPEALAAIAANQPRAGAHCVKALVDCSEPEGCIRAAAGGGAP